MILPEINFTLRSNTHGRSKFVRSNEGCDPYQDQPMRREGATKMIIKKLIAKNFKKFGVRTFQFNDDINILVGDNAAGKSSILEAIEIATNCTYRGKTLTHEMALELFSTSASQTYLASDLKYTSLPEVVIEVFLDGVPEYRGANNSLGEDAQGITFKISFDMDLREKYEELAKKLGNVLSIPIEFFKIEWFDFGWNSIKAIARKTKSVLIDPSRLHPTFGKNQYITSILGSMLTKDQLAHLKLDFRQLKNIFDEQEHVQLINNGLEADKTISNDALKIVGDFTSGRGIEASLQLAVNEVSFPHVGKGEQNQIQIKLAMQNKAKSVDFLLLEEPENHLSHMNLTKLIKYVEDNRNDLQVFISTHSSYVLNKLSITKLCLVGKDYMRLKDVDPQIAKKMQRLPGYDTLRAVLASKVILVEGPSDELVLKKYYLSKHDKLPEEDGIEIIVVRGIGFATYLEIAKEIGIRVHVAKDNDGDYKKNIEEYQQSYKAHNAIKFFSPTENSINSLEPALIAEHANDVKTLDSFSKLILSPQTYNVYEKMEDLAAKVKFLREWFAGETGSGTKKVDSAMRIFNSSAAISYPNYLVGAFNFA
jgi:putative ATP-dependent endonuclease of OLD family